MRACDLSLIVHGDHGYGNALNVMRTVQELEHAGASCVTIEDLALPRRFGSARSSELVSIDEMTGKLHAALAARTDPAFVVTAALPG
jgi:carboxyvinyl-carboxyphosphonate phosphorylmutase